MRTLKSRLFEVWPGDMANGPYNQIFAMLLTGLFFSSGFFIFLETMDLVRDILYIGLWTTFFFVLMQVMSELYVLAGVIIFLIALVELCKKIILSPQSES
ncbi:MAG: hypothetical protein HYW77_02160 [Parcubacteria group bacterium]|nr:hypothetical protein [Parcubacteria group bacterium]